MGLFKQIKDATAAAPAESNEAEDIVGEATDEGELDQPGRLAPPFWDFRP
jgi:hypothetical protein